MKWEIEIPDKTIKELEGMIGKALEMTMYDIVADIVQHCPVKTGDTRNKIWGEVKDKTIIIHAGGAIVYIEYGTPPHIIRPKDKKALFWKGAEHPVKVVNHPGTRPNPIVRSAIHRGLMEYLPDRLQQVFDPWAG